jgi:anti-sigma factor RsiW
MKHDLELKLQAWLDGELPAAEAEQMRRRAATDLEAARLTAELQNIKAAFLQSAPFIGAGSSAKFNARHPSATPLPRSGRSGCGAGWPPWPAWPPWPPPS